MSTDSELPNNTKTGDVISLAGVPIIYGEDTPVSGILADIHGYPAHPGNHFRIDLMSAIIVLILRFFLAQPLWLPWLGIFTVWRELKANSD